MRQRKTPAQLDTIAADGKVRLGTEVHPGLREAPNYEAMAERLGEDVVSHLCHRRDGFLWPQGSDGPIGAAQAVKQRIALLEHQAKHAGSARQVTLDLSGDSMVSLAVGKRNAARHWLDVTVLAMRAYLDALGLQEKETIREIQEREEREAKEALERAERKRTRMAREADAAQSAETMFKEEGDAAAGHESGEPAPDETPGEANRRKAAEIAAAAQAKVDERNPESPSA